MALLPCSGCGQRFIGRASSFYPALLLGSQSQREKLRLCPACTKMYTTACEEHLFEVDWSAPSQTLPEDRPVCGWCSAEDPSGAMFVTHYIAGADRGDFYGAVCSACEKAALSQMLIART